MMEIYKVIFFLKEKGRGRWTTNCFAHTHEEAVRNAKKNYIQYWGFQEDDFIDMNKYVEKI
ncbi:hypothetical protein [Pseudoneobacillus sp. C159]